MGSAAYWRSQPRIYLVATLATLNQMHTSSIIHSTTGVHPGYAQGEVSNKSPIGCNGDTEGAQGVLDCPLGNTLLSELVCVDNYIFTPFDHSNERSIQPHEDETLLRCSSIAQLL